MSNLILERIREKGYEKFGREVYQKALDQKERELQLAELLAERRNQMNINQKDLAIFLDTSQQQISKYEKAESLPKLEVLLKILDKLNLEMVVVDRENKKELLHI